MNPFRYSVNRNRFTSSDLSSLGNSTILKNSPHSHRFIVARSLLNDFDNPWLACEHVHHPNQLDGSTRAFTSPEVLCFVRHLQLRK